MHIGPETVKKQNCGKMHGYRTVVRDQVRLKERGRGRDGEVGKGEVRMGQRERGITAM